MSDTVIVKVWHGGKLTKKPKVTYVGGETDVFQVEVEKMSYFELAGYVKEFETCKSKDFRMFYLVPGKKMEDGLVELKNDKDVGEMMNQLGDEFIHILQLYVEVSRPQPTITTSHNEAHQGPKKTPTSDSRGSGSGSRGGGVRTLGRGLPTRGRGFRTPERRISEESGSNGKSKKTIQTHGRYMVVRGKGGGIIKKLERGSNSYVDRDEMNDTPRVFRNTIGLRDRNSDEDERDDSVDDGNDQCDGNDHYDGSDQDDGIDKDDSFEIASVNDVGGERPRIKRVGDKFGYGVVHKSAIDILQQNLDGAWPTFARVPPNKLRDMFNIFRTKWKWDSRDDQHIYEGFVNVLKDRYRDLMKELRQESEKKAIADGHVIADNENKFDVLCNYPPEMVLINKWQSLCKIWNTPEWRNRSAVGKSNRKEDKSLHTGGSMGFEEHRIRLEKQNGGKIDYKYLFVDTHATKECKKRLREGKIKIDDLKDLDFITPKSEASFKSFTKELEKVYGPNKGENIECDELAVWKSLHPNSRFGIGSSDPRFVVTGKPSSFCGYTSNDDYKEVDVMSQLEKEREARQNLETRLKQHEVGKEQELEARQNLEKRLKQHEVEKEQERTEIEKLKKLVEELMKK